jgi:hypothetical protein
MDEAHVESIMTGQPRSLVANGGVKHEHSVEFCDAIRIPMMLLALAGSLLNLVVLWQVWRLRRHSASAWRQQSDSDCVYVIADARFVS